MFLRRLVDTDANGGGELLWDASSLELLKGKYPASPHFMLYLV
jgi:hypothetical protein